MKKCAPVPPSLAVLEPGEQQLYSLEIAVYGWEKLFFFLKKMTISLHAKLHLRAHLTDRRLILEPDSSGAVPAGVLWAARILGELLQTPLASFAGRLVEVGQEQQSEQNDFSAEVGWIAVPFEEIESFDVIERGYVSLKLRNIQQPDFERLTFIPYPIKGSLPLSEELAAAANDLLARRRAY
jgi:hypothetical protein